VTHCSKLPGRDAPQSLERTAKRALLRITEQFRYLGETQIRLLHILKCEIFTNLFPQFIERRAGL
jgi:hypothetical protein